MLRLYDYRDSSTGHWDSGNGYKVRLALAQLGIAYELVPIDIDKGESRTPQFLARNANGRIPVIEFENGAVLAQSNAILCHLAEGTPLMPAPGFDRALVLQWLFFEQYDHEPNIATARYWIRHGHLTPEREPLLAQKRAAGNAALALMEAHLSSRRFLIAERYSVADIALYAYTHVADEGGFDLVRFPAVSAWLARVAAQPGHVQMLADRAVLREN